MNKSILFLIALIVISITLLLGCTQATTQNTDANIVKETVVIDKNVPIEVTPGTPPLQDTNTYTVAIRSFNFTPATLTIKVGDTVNWRNEDSVGHTVTGGVLDSPVMQTGQTFSYTFKTTGTIDYICTPHPSMKGKIIVQ